MPPRMIGWFSAGEASAVACKLLLAKYRTTHEVIIARIILPAGAEHEDGDRFAADCARWFDHPITAISNPEFDSLDALFDRKRYMSGRYGAPCTGVFKKAARYEFQRRGDIHAFGLTVEERHRVKRLQVENPDLELIFPLIDTGLKKADCAAIVERAGIERHAMYRLGFPNANCRGCVKDSSPKGWNRTRRHFPDVFAARAIQSRRLGCRLVELHGDRIFLDELPPDAGGKDDDEPTFDCSLLCYSAELTTKGSV